MIILIIEHKTGANNIKTWIYLIIMDSLKCKVEKAVMDVAGRINCQIKSFSKEGIRK